VSKISHFNRKPIEGIVEGDLGGIKDLGAVKGKREPQRSMWNM
jgi:hypothetical protein